MPDNALTRVNQMASKSVNRLTIGDRNNIIDDFVAQDNTKNNNGNEIKEVDRTNADIDVDFNATNAIPLLLEPIEQDLDSNNQEDDNDDPRNNDDDDDDDNDNDFDYGDMLPLIVRDADEYRSSDDGSFVKEGVTTCSGRIVFYFERR